MAVKLTLADRRSPEAAIYRRWYSLARWKKIKAEQRRKQPLCEMCLEKGIVTAMAICDHAEPHRGDEEKFWNGPFKSLCKSHHDGLAQARDNRGYTPGCDIKGRPVDPNHPWNRTAP